MSEAARGDDGGEGDHGVVAEVHEETGEDGPGARANVGEDNTHNNQHENEEQTGKADAGKCAEGLCEERVQVAAEDGLLNERGDEDGHAHEKDGAGAIFEQILNGHVLRRLNFGTDQRDANGQAGTGEKVEPGIGGRGFGGDELPPAERTPERQVVQDGDGDVQEEKDQAKQKKVRTDGDLRLGDEELLQFLRGEAAMRGLRSEINGEAELRDDKADEGKEKEDEKMRPRPSDAQVLGELRIGVDRDSSGGLRGGGADRFSRWARGGGIRLSGGFGGEWLWIERAARVVAVRSGHLFFVLRRGDFGQPESRAAEKRGNSSSWWPVKAYPCESGVRPPRKGAVGRLTTFCVGR